jgi:hypothetical protein
MAQRNLGSVSKRSFRGEIAHRWQQLTTSDIEECCMDRSKLRGLLEIRYGFARSRAEKEVELFYGEFQNRLRLAA